MITAAYGGDSSHGPSHGETSVKVALPASTRGCAIGAAGAITARDGDWAEILAFAGPRGRHGFVHYGERGPAERFELQSHRIEAVVCASGASRASLFGVASLDRTIRAEYRIDLTPGGERAGRGTFRIRLADGYDSGTQTLRRGGVTVHRRRG